MRLSDLPSVIRHLGVSWALFRVRYAIGRRLGGLRRASPLQRWDELQTAELSLGTHTRGVPASDECVLAAEAVLRGEFRLFSGKTVAAGFPPRWNVNQLGGGFAPTEPHWSTLGDFSFGDIKGVWELSRFSWAYTLVRAFARTGDRKFADAFWMLFEDWCAKNPPNAGPNWMCGQETAIRLSAVVFAAEEFGLPETQRDRLTRFVVASGRRIAANLDYALSQKNNHGVSECVGLLTAALLLPSHAESVGWQKRALTALQAQVEELVYPDGGFSQHSIVYHRVLLHQLCWAKSRLHLAQIAVPSWLNDAGARASRWLDALTDPLTGEVPLIGPNDGANVLPLSDADFLDFRPDVQMAAALFLQRRAYGPGPWDELATWFVEKFATLPLWERPAPIRWHAEDSGVFQLRSGTDRLVLRCPTHFRHRPNQADMLHVDVWLAGRAIALDGGSFSYNSRERFLRLGSAREHNVLTVNGLEPMKKVSRFLYLPWARGTAREEGDGGFVASHDGYAASGVDWERAVSLRSGNGFLVRDRATGTNDRVVRWHWRLADLPWRIDGDGVVAERYFVRWRGLSGAKVSLVRADDASASGWRSSRYAEVEPAVALIIEARATSDVQVQFEFFRS